MNNLVRTQRLQANTNLRLHYDSTFRGLPVMVGKGPFIHEYLDKLLITLQRAQDEHSRVFAARFDLRFPEGSQLPADSYTSQVVQRFVDSLKAKINHDRARSKQAKSCSHGTSIRYVWAKEIGQGGKPHYHFLLLLNRDAYHTFGLFNSEFENMYGRIQAAWASALGLPCGEGIGLVHVPQNAVYGVFRGDGEVGLEGVFNRASYLCKAATKVYGDGSHSFGCSRL